MQVTLVVQKLAAEWVVVVVVSQVSRRLESLAGR